MPGQQRNGNQRGNNSFAPDYVDVAERVAEFRAKYPEGTLQPADPAHPYRLEKVGEATFITVVAAAYRTPDDPRPGIGMAQEPLPGLTPYTKNSELQNAETSAWGRAIVAVGAADAKRGIASADEVRNRREEQDAPQPPPQAITRAASLVAEVGRLALAAGITAQVAAEWAATHDGQDIRLATAVADLELMRDDLLRQAGPRAVPA